MILNKDKFQISIWRWFIAGLFIRFLIMPFAFHGLDLVWIYYLPYKYVVGAMNGWDPYLFLKQNYPNAAYSYYPPILFWIISGFMTVLKPLLPHLDKLYVLFEKWNFTATANTNQYASLLINSDLFRTLFVLKLPFLIFDCAAGFILLNMFKSNRSQTKIVWIVWMLNPFVLHSTYGIGQVDVMIAFFICLCVLFHRLKRPYCVVTSLICGALVKVSPIILLPVAILVESNTWMDFFKLSVFSVIMLFSFLLPFFLSSGGLVLYGFKFSSTIPSLRRIAYVVCYMFSLGILFWLKNIKKEGNTLFLLISFFTIVLLLFYSISSVNFRYFVWITPLLIMLAYFKKRMWIYSVIFLVSLSGLRLAGNTLQWGLFSSLCPEFFSGLPILDSFLNTVFDVSLLHKGMFKLFFVTSFILVVDLLWIQFRNPKKVYV